MKALSRPAILLRALLSLAAPAAAVVREHTGLVLCNVTAGFPR